MKVENVVERGKIGEDHIVHERDRQAFSKWNTPGFTRHEHPTIIQVQIHIISALTTPKLRFTIVNFYDYFCYNIMCLIRNLIKINPRLI